MSNDSQDKGDKPREQAPRTPQQQQQSGSQQGRDQGGSQQDRDSQQRQGGSQQGRDSQKQGGSQQQAASGEGRQYGEGNKVSDDSDDASNDSETGKRAREDNSGRDGKSVK